MEAVVGRRVLGEIEEMSLEEVLEDLRAAVDQSSTTAANNITSTIPLHPSLTRRLKLTHIPALDEVAARHAAATHNPALSVAGRSLPLVYAVVAALVSPPHRRAVLVIDLDGRFDPARLACDPEDLRHVYVQRSARRSSPEDVKSLVAEAGSWMLYGRATTAASHTATRSGVPDQDVSSFPLQHHSSADRQWWGTVVLGSSHASAGDMTASWKGWLRVDRAAVSAFAMGSSAQEAMDRRDARQEVVDVAGWAAASPWGSFGFNEGTNDRTEG